MIFEKLRNFGDFSFRNNEDCILFRNKTRLVFYIFHIIYYNQLKHLLQQQHKIYLYYGRKTSVQMFLVLMNEMFC